MSAPVWSNGAFREAFPEFSDTVKYPDGTLTLWSGLAVAQVNAGLWGDQTMLGWQLYVAHELVLSSQNKAAANAGGPTGQTSGPASQKTVGSVSVQYDTQSTTEKDAGYWNLTSYGKQFIRLARLFGAGAAQISGGFPCR